MKCYICGTEFPEGVSFCPTCGSKAGEEMLDSTEITQVDEIQTPMAETAPIQDIAMQTAENDFAQGVAAQTATAKKSNKGLVIGICAGIAAAVAVIVLCVCLFFSKPIDIVERALVATISGIEKELSSASAKMPINIVMDKICEKSMNMDTKLDVTEIGGMASSGMVSVEQNMKINDKTEQVVCKTNLAVLGYEFTFDAKTDGNTVGFNIPQLYDGYYGVQTNSIYEDSIAATFENKFDFTENVNFELLGDGTTDKPVKFITEKTEKDIIDNLNVFEKTIVVERCNDTKSTNLNGTDVKCKEYVAAVKASDCQKFISTAFTLLSEDELYSAEIEKVLAKGEYTYDEFEDKFFTILDSVFENIDEEINMSYFIQKGKVVKIASVIDFGDVVADMVLELGDGKTLTDVMSANLKGFDTENDEEMHISIVSKGNHSGKDNLYTDETKFEMSTPSSDEPLKLTFATNYDFDKAEDNFDFNCKLAIPADDEYKLNLTGTLAADKAKNIVIVDFENATVLYGGETMIACNMNYNISELNVNDSNFDESEFIKKDEITNVFKMEQSDIDKLLEEIGDNAMENYGDIINVFINMMIPSK